MRPAGSRWRGIAETFGVWGEWAHYVAAVWIAYTRGGVALVAAYLIVSSAPGLLKVSWPGAYRRLAPVGLAGLAVGFGHLSPAGLLLLGAVVGVGNAAAGRPPAWTAGLVRPSAQGAAGALAAGLGISAGLGQAVFLAAAMSAVLGRASPHSPDPSPPRPQAGLLPGLLPAAAGLAAACGLRALEPALVVAGSSGTGSAAGPVSAASFAAAWSLGATAGWRLAPRTDLRATLSAPFLGAASIALLTVAKGPGLLLLHFFIAGCAGLTAGGATTRPSKNLWEGRRSLWLIAAAEAAAVAWMLSRSPASFENALWLAAAAALVGGFTSLAALRRKAAVTEPPSPSAPEPFEQALPETAIEEKDEKAVAAAISLLRDALVQARTIRTEALRAVPLASPGSQTFDHARANVRAVADELESGINKAAAAMRGWRSA